MIDVTKNWTNMIGSREILIKSLKYKRSDNVMVEYNKRLYKTTKRNVKKTSIQYKKTEIEI